MTTPDEGSRGVSSRAGESPEQMDPRPMEVHAGDSPVNSTVPFWVTACVRLAPPVGRTGKPTEAADKVVTAAQVLLADRVRVDGEDRVLADRHTLARFLGYQRSDKARWVTDYLERIHFLSIKDQEQDRRGRRRNRMDPNTGRAVPDQWSVREQPPLGYAGPRSFAELRDALADGRLWDLEELFVSVQVSSSPSREGPREASSPSREGPRAFLQVSSSPSREGPREASSPSREGLDTKPQVNSSPSREGPFEGEERERTLSESSLSRSIGGSAPPPAMGGPGDDAPEDAVTVEVRDLVRRLPWEDTSKGRTAAVLEDANHTLVPAIAAAVRSGWLDLDGAREHALRKLAQADRNPVPYVATGFAAKNIPLPTPDDVLAMTGQQAAEDEAAPDTEAAGDREGAGEGEVGEQTPRQPSTTEVRRQFMADIERAEQGRKRQKIVQSAQRSAEALQGQEHTA